MKFFSIIGDGGWGTALALLLHKNGMKVKLWGVFPDYIRFLKRKRENVKFLPGIKIPKQILITDDLKLALTGARLIILATPSQYLRCVLNKIKQLKMPVDSFLSVAKGLEYRTNKRMSEIIHELFGPVKVAVLSGPNIASEIVRGIPSASVCASRNPVLRKIVQDALMTDTFRVYTNNDLIGVELAGALKNIIAIACGISDGLGFGTNTKAALLTRGLSETTRLGVEMGAKYKTFSGLSGIGDLVTTCLNPKSRNRSLGELIGQGNKLNNILKKTEMVVEGVVTTKTAIKLAKIHNVEMPITQEVFNVLYGHKNPLTAVRSLMQRTKKME